RALGDRRFPVRAYPEVIFPALVGLMPELKALVAQGQPAKKAGVLPPALAGLYPSGHGVLNPPGLPVAVAPLRQRVDEVLAAAGILGVGLEGLPPTGDGRFQVAPGCRRRGLQVVKEAAPPAVQVAPV